MTSMLVNGNVPSDDQGSNPDDISVSVTDIETITWWRHQMEKFSALLALCEGNPPVTDGFPSQRPVTRSFDIFYDQRLNKLLSKQPRRRSFETPSHSLCRHSNAYDDPSFNEKTLENTDGWINHVYHRRTYIRYNNVCVKTDRVSHILRDMLYVS